MRTQTVADTTTTQPDATGEGTAPALSVVPDTKPTRPTVRVDADPATLLLDHNVRLTTTADKTLTESVRDHGVLVPIVAVRTPDGALRVRYGHRRTLAAIAVGLPTVPVDDVADEDDDQVDRVLRQWAENEHRQPLQTQDRIAAVAQLAAFGMTAAQITKRTKAPRAEVDQALTASGSVLATKAAGRYDFLDLEMAATVAEFQDSPETVKTLVAAAKDGPGEFAHTASRARQDRDRAAAKTAAVDALAAEGTTVIDRPSYDDKKIKGLSELLHEGKPVTAKTHATCPGHAAYVTTQYANKAEPTYVCTDPKTHGHTGRYASTAITGGGLTDAEKALRATTRENNVAWRAAEPVRRAFLTSLVTRKTPPKGTAKFLARELVDADHPIRRALETRNAYAMELLGWKTTSHHVDGIDKATDHRATMVALTVILAAYETATDVTTWRNASNGTARYLTFLETCGYTLSDVERLCLPKTSKSRKPSTSKTTGTSPLGPVTVTDTSDYDDHPKDDQDDQGAAEAQPDDEHGYGEDDPQD